MPTILYSGIGAKPSGIHTVQEFLECMRRTFTEKHWALFQLLGNNHYQLEFQGRNLPEEFPQFTLQDWLEYSGAELSEN